MNRELIELLRMIGTALLGMLVVCLFALPLIAIVFLLTVSVDYWIDPVAYILVPIMDNWPLISHAFVSIGSILAIKSDPDNEFGEPRWFLIGITAMMMIFFFLPYIVLLWEFYKRLKCFGKKPKN